MGRDALAFGVLGPGGRDSSDQLPIFRHEDGICFLLDLRSLRHLHFIGVSFRGLCVINHGIDLRAAVAACDRSRGRAVLVVEGDGSGVRRGGFRRRAGERQRHGDGAVSAGDRHIRSGVGGDCDADASLRRLQRVCAGRASRNVGGRLGQLAIDSRDGLVGLLRGCARRGVGPLA